MHLSIGQHVGLQGLVKMWISFGMSSCCSKPLSQRNSLYNMVSPQLHSTFQAESPFACIAAQYLNHDGVNCQGLTLSLTVLVASVHHSLMIIYCDITSLQQCLIYHI